MGAFNFAKLWKREENWMKAWWKNPAKDVDISKPFIDYPKNILSAQQICCMNWIFQGQLLQLKCVTTLVEVHFNFHMVLFSLLVKKEVYFILLYFILFLKIFLKCIFLCKKIVYDIIVRILTNPINISLHKK